MEKYKVFSFRYNGFALKVGKTLTKYTATFKEWTDDPGVAVFECSDGEERKIPVRAVKNFNYDNHPEQKWTKRPPLILGEPSSSSKRLKVGFLCPLD